jgi:glycosyltransferase involved in cell wall biosynthesis
MHPIPPADTAQPPLVVQYLYVHAPGDSYDYPSSRAQAVPEQLAERYLECGLVQAASLRLRDVECRMAFVSNVSDVAALGSRGARLWAQIESLDVAMLHAEYDHRHPHELSRFASSCYVLDAIEAALAHAERDARLWFTDVDCVWIDAPLLFAAAPPPGQLGCIHIPYPPDWEVNGYITPRELGKLAERMGGEDAPTRWVGGELLCGAAADLQRLVRTCERLESELAERGLRLETEEQLFSIAAALGRVSFDDLSHVAQRIWTGPRHRAPAVAQPQRLGLWHLPSEKGLGFRRAADELLAGRTRGLGRDLADPNRAMKRFNVAGAGGLVRRIRDDAWLAAQRLRAMTPARLVRERRDPAPESTRRRRLLMIEQGGRGGVTDYTAELTRALAAEGWEVTIATASDHRFAPAEGVTVRGVFHYVRGSSRLARVARRARLGPTLNGVRFLLAVPRLVSLARRADVVHDQGWEFAPLGLVAIAAMRLAGATLVQTPHNTFERGRSLDRTNALLARLCARTIVHAEADLARVSKTAEGKVVVIAHGEYGALARAGGSVDREVARSELGIEPVAPVALLFGQLRVDKGLEDLLAAQLRLPDLHVLIGGQESGALAACAGLLADPRLSGRVTLREGFLEMSEAATLFAAADVAVLPYRVASQSGVLLLAYGFRRPVVVYPVGGLPESVLEGETGWVCSSGDVDSLVAVLADVLAGGWPECRRRGEAGARLAEERFAWPAIARRTAALYEEAIAER